MAPVRRHQLAYLTDAGWRRVLALDWDGQAHDCLSHWATHRLPLVVTRQPPSFGIKAGENIEKIALGLPAPLRWERRRIALTMARTELLYFDEFPRAESVVDLLPARARSDWLRLCNSLAARFATARVYGSYGWQFLSGLNCVRATSDVDLWLSVDDPLQAHKVTTRLLDFDHCVAPRLDGELLFADGSAVAWREWSRWRAGGSAAILIKRIDGPSLETSIFRSAAEKAVS